MLALLEAEMRRSAIRWWFYVPEAFPQRKWFGEVF